MLLKREYIVRNGKSLEATDKGIRLIEVVHPEVKSPVDDGPVGGVPAAASTGATAQLEPFMTGIEDYVREVVGKVGQIPARRKIARAPSAAHPPARRRSAPPATAPRALPTA